MKPVVLSGIQPSGRLHIGNYLGALKNFVELQESGMYQPYFMIADLHSLTESYRPAEKREQIIDLAATYLAAGLDPEKSTLFIQSHVPAHTELAWILNTITPMGELERMTQYKDKGNVKDSVEHLSHLSQISKAGSNELDERIASFENLKNEAKEISILTDTLTNGITTLRSFFEYHKKITELTDNILIDLSKRLEINVGLFEYPVLMAADIILYDAAMIPVGDDQDQHLELTRTLARKFNSRFGETFVEPKALHTATPRVMSLDEPTKKMSKSRPAGCLFIDDEPEVIKKKIMSAVTDSESEVRFDEVHKPGVSNLLLILNALTGKSIQSLETEFAGKQYGAFKTEVANIVTEYFAPLRERKVELLKSPEKVLAVFTTSSQKAHDIAGKKLKEVYEKVGLIW